MFTYIRGSLLIIILISSTVTDDKPGENILNTKTTVNNVSKRVVTTDRTQEKSEEPKKQWKFEDYMKKFEPATIWEQIDKQKKYNGLVLTEEEQSEMMFQGMDPTDELMELKIENGDPKILVEKDGRRGWKPSGGEHWYQFDRFFLRKRMYELMKQAIYQTRNKMIIMQMYREKYSNSSLYRMGFMMNKADNAAKTLGRFSFRAYRGCLLGATNTIEETTLFQMLSMNERQLNLLFSLELLTELIIKNDEICKEIFRNRTEKRTQTFDKKIIY
uniref:Uncharacterized protein n=1 Tax=Heliothis virescens TaxID=7102 RepID=A0A2A4K7G9_HELVI